MIFRTLGLLALMLSNAVAEISVSVTPCKVVGGLVSPRVVQDCVLVDAKSSPNYSDGALIKVESAAKFVRVKARSQAFAVVKAHRVSDSEWVIAGDGKYIVEVTTFDEATGIEDDEVEVTIGGGIQPTPPGPYPPGPTPPPVVILDEYHVGKIAYDNAPRDAAGAKSIANIYRVNALRLYGQGGLSTIENVISDIGRQLDSRTCTDPIICGKWKEWRVLVSAALVQEQRRRGTFSRKDWYSAFVEIATALEAVR